jgi:hypothetical protein
MSPLKYDIVRLYEGSLAKLHDSTCPLDIGGLRRLTAECLGKLAHGIAAAHESLHEIEARTRPALSAADYDAPWPQNVHRIDLPTFARMLARHQPRWRNVAEEAIAASTMRRLQLAPIVVGSHRLQMELGNLGSNGQVAVFVIRTAIEGGGS